MRKCASASDGAVRRHSSCSVTVRNIKDNKLTLPFFPPLPFPSFFAPGSAGRWHYTVNDAYDAPQNVCSMGPSTCPFAKLYKQLIKEFAGDSGRWEAAYSGAYARMTEIGATWGPHTASATLKA